MFQSERKDHSSVRGIKNIRNNQLIRGGPGELNWLLQGFLTCEPIPARFPMEKSGFDLVNGGPGKGAAKFGWRW
jgi:hypothetical protein